MVWQDSRSGERRSLTRALWVGLAVSLVVHLVLIGLYGRFFRSLAPSEQELAGPRIAWEPQLRVVPLEAPASGVPAVTAPRTPVRERPAEAVDTAPADEGTAPDLGERIVTNAERLRPHQGDRRLWLPPVEGPLTRLERQGHERAEDALRALLQVYLDSLTLSQEQRRAAREWVVEGEEGERWGVSPEGIHLGNVTIPLPLGQLFSEGGPKAREARQALRDFNMIQQQSMKQEAEAVREERLDAMRERTREALERLEENDDDSTSSEADTSIAGR